MSRVAISFIATGIVLFVSCKNDTKSKQRKKNSDQLMVDATTDAKPNTSAGYNIMIENSGSMNGYVAAGSDFKDAVLGLITDLKSKSITNVVNIYYINKQICPQKMGALPKEIEYFFTNLNPASFSRSGCGTSSSYIPEVIQKAVSTNTDDVNILVSDFIFSDSLGASPKYLEAAKNTVKLYLSDALKQRDFSMIVLKLNSQFEGYYYVESQRPLKIDLRNKNIRRPYYIIVFGKQQSLQHFLSKINFGDYKGFENSYYLLTPANSKPVAKVIRNNKIGEYEIEQPATNLVINNAKAGGRNADPNTFQFSVAADLGFLKMDNTYLTDPGNYSVSGNYTITSIKTADDANESLKGYTHVFILKTNELRPMQDVLIKLKSKLPAWVKASSTLDDADPADTVQQRQTFGFEYMVRGMAEAYADHYDGKEQFAITVKVSTNNYAAHGNSSGFPWWIAVSVTGLFGLIIWIKNKK